VWIGPEDVRPVRAVDGSERVEFTGMRRDMRAAYSAMDIFVLPSYREGLPRSAMEAAACARPMVLSDIRGCQEIGRPGVEALFVPARSAEQLWNAVERLLGAPDERARLGAAARDKATRDFDQREVARRCLRLYRELSTAK